MTTELSLADHEATLSLFTEGIAGRYLHILASEEFAVNPRLRLDMPHVGQGSDTLFLPEKLKSQGSGAYRVLIMQQLGLRECGTLQFRLAEALERIPSLVQRARQARENSPRAGEFRMLFDAFPAPNLAERLMMLFERARIQAHLLRHYPGLRHHLDLHHLSLREAQLQTSDPLERAECWLMGDESEASGPVEIQIRALLESQLRQASSVYDSAQALCQSYDVVAAHYETQVLDGAEKQESLVDWLSREQRMEDWEQELEDMSQQLAERMASLQSPTGEETEAILGDLGEGTNRDADIDITTLKKEKDNLKRRIDMERSSISQALGDDHGEARSFRYDEWDYLQSAYLRAWCRVFEHRLTPDSQEKIEPLNQVIRTFRPLVQSQLEQIRPSGLERMKRVQDGDELDLNAIIEARQDIRAGQSPDERFYSRRERIQRDVCAAFLVDLSASTDDPVIPPEPIDWSECGDDAEMDLRTGWYAALAPEPELASAPVRKIIDLEREAMVVMAAALDALGDSYGIYGFSGYSKDKVNIYVAKEPGEAFSNRTLQSIAAMRPKGSTRMGPAIRHTSQKLMASGHALRVLIVLSDGFPQDCDYGPERGNHDYGVADTAKALREAQQRGIETFCITVDKSGNDYLKTMCPDARYIIIEEMEDLPEQLTKVYAALTAR